METTANNAMRTLKVKSVVTRRGFFVFTNCWHSRRGSRETEGESIGGQHFTPKEREREKRERERERERERSRRIDAQRRESTKSTSPRPFETVPSRKNEKTARSSRPSLWGNQIPREKEREREREPAGCPTASAYLDRPVREQVILHILQNVTQTHARDVQNTLSSLARARVKLVPVQRSAESKGTRGSFEEEERRGPIFFTLLKGGKKITIKRIRTIYSARVLVTVRLIKFFPSLVIITLFISLSLSLSARACDN